MKKILITGGAGFIGSHLANYLHENNYNVLVIDNLKRGDYSRLNKNILIKNIDLTSFDQLSSLDKNFQYIFHLAAINGTDNFYNQRSSPRKLEGILFPSVQC